MAVTAEERMANSAKVKGKAVMSEVWGLLDGEVEMLARIFLTPISPRITFQEE